MENQQALIAGVDEAGRGPLAGPVVAAAVILDPSRRPIRGLADSKQLTAEQRETLYIKIIEQALDYGIGRAEVEEIDTVNIHQATFLAMQRAVAALKLKPAQILIDGNQCPRLPYPAQAIIDGDQKIKVISAASILAKVTRDREMIALSERYPNYGFAKHKGYGTPQHLQALFQLGPCPIHRWSFLPIRTAVKALLGE